MKKTVILLLVLALTLSFTACTRDIEQADGIAKEFVTAFLARDEEGMKKHIHPDYLDSALPDDEFYSALEKQHLSFESGLTELYVVGKTDYKEIRNALKCSYVARVNELFYSVELIIVDDKNGTGIASFAMVFNNNPDYYYNEYLETGK